MVYHFQIHKEKKGFWAECIELDGCRAQGDNMAELQKNASEVLNLYLSEPENSKLIFPEPKRIPHKKDVLAVMVDPHVYFALTLRQLRLKRKLSQKQIAAEMGFKSTFAYQKLESPKTCNPGLDTMVRLKRIFPNLKIDRALEVED